ACVSLSHSTLPLFVTVHCISQFASLLFLFFTSNASPRALHSFPTRRSSDLGALWRTAWARRGPPCKTGWRPGRTADPGRPPATRSEEHTSELQSRFDLVCRLLLEKKK